MKMKRKMILGIAVMLITAAVTGCNKKDGTSAGGSGRKVKPAPETDFEARPVDGGAGVEIAKYIGDSWEVNIPSKIRNLPVTGIGERAFSGKSLISVTIPNSVKTIGKQAFSGNQLTNVTIPGSVTEIGYNAFAENQLTGVTISKGVTHLSSFDNNQLTSVTIPNSVTHLSGFYNNQLTSVTIPDSVTTIWGGAFNSNRLTSVTIGNSVTSIGREAFRDNQLTSVTIPNSVTKIEHNAFYGNQLTSVTIGANVTLIYTLGSFSTFYAFNNGFDEAYNRNGKAAGTYTRPNTESTTWTKR